MSILRDVLSSLIRLATIAFIIGLVIGLVLGFRIGLAWDSNLPIPGLAASAR